MRKVLYLSWLLCALTSNAQLNPAAIDTAFQYGTHAPTNVNTILVAQDGRIIVGGKGQYPIFQIQTNGAENFPLGITSAPDEVNITVRTMNDAIIFGGAINDVAVRKLSTELIQEFNYEKWCTLKGKVNAIYIEPSGKALMGGELTIAGGTEEFGLVRLNRNGTLDSDFNIGTFSNRNVTAIGAYRSLIASSYTNESGVLMHELISTGNTDGSVTVALDGPVLAVNKFLVGGAFQTVDGSAQLRLFRMNENGRVDPQFKFSGANGEVRAIEFYPDGKILIGGTFTKVGDTPRAKIARLLDNGELDESFDAGVVDGAVNVIHVNFDGSIYAGGVFTFFGINSAAGFVKLVGDAALGKSFVWFERLETTVHERSEHGSVFVLRGGDLSAPTEVSVINVVVSASPTSIRIQNVPRTITFEAGETRKEVFFDIESNPEQAAFGSLGLGLVSNDPEVVISRDITQIWIEDAQSSGSLNTTYTYNPTIRKITALGTLSNGQMLAAENSISQPFIRLNPDGTRDNAFVPSLAFTAYGISGIRVLPDDRAYIWGPFTTTVNSYGRNFVGRMNMDGSWDTSFAPSLLSGPTPAGIAALTTQADGKVVIASLNKNLTSGPLASPIIRLQTNGSSDSSFQFTISPSVHRDTRSLMALPSGKVLAAGSYTWQGNVVPLLRLNTNGSVDTSFKLDLQGTAYAVALQGEKILVGGIITNKASHKMVNLARMNADGSLDPTFNAVVDGTVTVLALDSDNNIYLAGEFTTVNATDRFRLARLNPEGILDSNFNTHFGFTETPGSISFAPDHDILVGGYFNTYNNAPVSDVVKLMTSAVVPFYILIHGDHETYEITTTARPGQTYRLLGTPNFVGWSLISTQTATETKLTFPTQPITGKYQFFKVEEQ
jgi:uncharacterized delta-60 repeat protein